MFVTLNGAIERWRPALGNTAELLSPTFLNSYDGATLVTVNGNEYLLAANHPTGNIDVFNGTRHSARLVHRASQKYLEGFSRHFPRIIVGEGRRLCGLTIGWNAIAVCFAPSERVN